MEESIQQQKLNHWVSTSFQQFQINLGEALILYLHSIGIDLQIPKNQMMLNAHALLDQVESKLKDPKIISQIEHARGTGPFQSQAQMYGYLSCQIKDHWPAECTTVATPVQTDIIVEQEPHAPTPLADTNTFLISKHDDVEDQDVTLQPNTFYVTSGWSECVLTLSFLWLKANILFESFIGSHFNTTYKVIEPQYNANDEHILASIHDSMTPFFDPSTNNNNHHNQKNQNDEEWNYLSDVMNQMAELNRSRFDFDPLLCHWTKEMGSGHISFESFIQHWAFQVVQVGQELIVESIDHEGVLIDQTVLIHDITQDSIVIERHHHHHNEHIELSLSSTHFVFDAEHKKSIDIPGWIFFSYQHSESQSSIEITPRTILSWYKKYLPF